MDDSSEGDRIEVELWLRGATNSVAAERLPADAAGFAAALAELVRLTRRALPSWFSVHSLRLRGWSEVWRLGYKGAPGAAEAFRAAAAAIRAAARGTAAVVLNLAVLRVADVGGAMRLELLDPCALTALPAADIDPVHAARRAVSELLRARGRPTSARLVFAPGAALFAPAVPVAGAGLEAALAALLAGPDAAAAVAVDVAFSAT